MSIILKGIDLPTDGKTLIVGIYGNGLVSMEYTKPLVLAIEINAEAIQIPKDHGRLIDANKLNAMMYHEAFETDSDLQKWDSGCWIRYKVFENCMNKLLPDTILEAEAEK